MSKILANQIANYGDDSPIEIKEGLNIPTGKPLQAAGESGSSGQLLSSTGSSVEWVTPFDGSYNSLTDKPSIPSPQVQSDWNAVGTLGEILNKPIVPPTPSVVVSAPGVSNLTYGVGNGQFTYTPPDLSGYATTASVANAANWDTAYGWGDHSTAGYLTEEADTLANVVGRGNTVSTQIIAYGGVRGGTISSGSSSDVQLSHNNSTHKSTLQHLNTWSHFDIKSVTDINILGGITEGGGVNLSHTANAGDNPVVRLSTTATGVNIVGDLSVTGTTDIDIEDLGNVDVSGGLSDQQVLKWDSASSSWLPANDLVGGVDGIALADLSVSTAAAGTAGLSYNNTNGVFTFTPPDLSDYDTAFGWGNHASAGYLTTETDPVFVASPAYNITLTDINQWDTAYGWGNHANGGYLVATSQDKTNWNTAFGWGDHSQAGYLTAEADTLATVVARGSTTGGDINFGDGQKAYFGASNDLQIYHGGSLNNHAYVTSTNGNLYLTSASNGAVHLVGYNKTNIIVQSTSVQLFYDTNLKLETSNTGVTVTGALTAGGLTYPTTNGTNGQVLTSDGTGNVTWAAGGIANATISDTAPGSPSAGDLWWESDKGRLKIYYNDTDSSQWVDASPPLADATSIGGQGTVAMLASLIPDTNDAYDIGSAEYKIRDIYEADPSDARLKTDVVDYTGGLAFLESLRVVDFTWKEDVDVKAGKRETGLIAQEVKEALDASNYNSWRLHTDGDLQGVDKKQLIPALISAIQELSARVKELENK